MESKKTALIETGNRLVVGRGRTLCGMGGGGGVGRWEGVGGKCVNKKERASKENWLHVLI